MAQRQYGNRILPVEPSRIVYDPYFMEEIKSIYPFLTPVLKKLTHEYVKERRQSSNVDSVSAKALNQLLEWMNLIHKDIEKNSLASIIASQRALIASDKKHRKQLLKRFNGDDMRAGNFLRDIALFLEHYEMIDESLFFMSKAKMYSPSLKPVDDKIEEYEAILKNTKKAFGSEKTNTIANLIRAVLRCLPKTMAKSIRAALRKVRKNHE